MKYKILGIIALVLMLGCAALATTLDAGGDTAREHQHLESRGPDAGCDCDGKALCTHLPLVLVDTKGQEIPGKVDDEKRDAYDEALVTKAADGNDFIRVDVSVIDNEDGNNHPSDTPTLTTLAEFNIRGHSSRQFEKAPYALNFIDETGDGAPAEVMGMEAHDEWVLHGPYLDKSLLRNYLWYNISGEIMEWAPNVRYCELIIDGEYEGLYVMTETITNGNDCRLNLTDEVDNKSISGYLLRSDRSTEENVGSIRDTYTYLERTLATDTDFDIRYPKRSSLDEEMREQIELDYAEFEKSLFSYDHDTHNYGYWNYIDEENFLDYYLINEFSLNLDAGSYSTYIYKDLGRKYKLAVWDFNNACDNYVDEGTGTDVFIMQEKMWYFMLMKSERFVDHLLERYWELRDSYLSDEYLLDYIDETLAYLGPAIDRNTERWGESISEWEPLSPASRNVHSQKEAVEQLKTFIKERGHWMDENIHSLQQYDHPSRNKTYNH